MKKKILLSVLLILCLAVTIALAGCDTIIQVIFGSGGQNNPNGSGNPDNKPPEHKHEMEYVSSEQPTCTGEGSVAYWKCKGCGKYFADEQGASEIADITVVSTGHLPTIQVENEYHYNKCEYCGETIGEMEPHASEAWVRTKSQHYKVCSVCSAEFDKASHSITDNECIVCHYFTNYADRCSSSYGYDFFETLTNGQKYQNFYDAIDSMASAFHASASSNASKKTTDDGYRYVCDGVNYTQFGLTQNEAMGVWATYRNDHPLYYWMLGNTLSSKSEIFTCVDYNYAKGADRAAENAKLYDAITEYLNVASGETSAYQIALAFHDEIIRNIKYSLDEMNVPTDENWAHSILGVFDKGEAVCDGYSRSFELLLNASGINNAIVTGTASQGDRSEGHAWNIAEIDGSWYWFDLTWDDQPQLAGGIVYDYFCQVALDEHKAGKTNDFSEGINYLYALPQASASNYNTEKLELGETFVNGGFTYKVCGYNKVTLEKGVGIGSIEIAEAVTEDGRTYNVVEIGKSAFTDNERVTTITIPKTVTVINNFAFNGCKKLTQVIFEDTEGWIRTSSNGKFQVEASALQNAAQAATLLKDTYRVGSSIYQYVWEKLAAPNETN